MRVSQCPGEPDRGYPGAVDAVEPPVPDADLAGSVEEPAGTDTDPPAARPADPAVAQRLIEAEEPARAAAVAAAAFDLGEAAADAAVGEHLDAVAEDPDSLTHYFAAQQGGYRGWRWSVTLSCGGAEAPGHGGRGGAAARPRRAGRPALGAVGAAGASR